MHAPRAVVVLTGAGASKPLGLPLMTDFVDEPFLRAGSNSCQLIAHLGLEWARANTKAIDLEYIYTLAHLLTDVELENPLAHSMTPGAGVAVRWSTGQGTETKEKAFQIADARDGARELRERIRTHVHDRLYSFDRQKGAAIYGEFLKPVIAGLDKGATVDIFTTNYDRVIEAIWESRLHNEAFGVPIVLRRGFRLVNEYSPSQEWDSTTYDQPSEAGDYTVRLFKLHGSLNWRAEGGRILETSANQYAANESTLIYPLKGVKDTAREPFTTLFARWRAAVSAATDCIVIGASMRDPQILQPLENTANQSPTFRVWLVDPRAAMVKATLPEAVRARTGELSVSFGDAGVGDQVAAAVFSPARTESSSD